MLLYRIGNLLNAPQKVIAHQVNCQGKMGSGVAKQFEISILRFMKLILILVLII